MNDDRVSIYYALFRRIFKRKCIDKRKMSKKINEKNENSIQS